MPGSQSHIESAFDVADQLSVSVPYVYDELGEVFVTTGRCRLDGVKLFVFNMKFCGQLSFTRRDVINFCLLVPDQVTIPAKASKQHQSVDGVCHGEQAATELGVVDVPGPGAPFQVYLGITIVGADGHDFHAGKQKRWPEVHDPAKQKGMAKEEVAHESDGSVNEGSPSILT